MGGIKYSQSDDAKPGDHQWVRPPGFTFQECRICGALKRTPVENERALCARSVPQEAARHQGTDP